MRLSRDSGTLALNRHPFQETPNFPVVPQTDRGPWRSGGQGSSSSGPSTVVPLEGITGIEILGSWQNPHIGSLTHGVRAINGGKGQVEAPRTASTKEDGKTTSVSDWIAEISASIWDLKGEGAVIPPHPHSISPVQKTGGSWRVTVDSHKLNEVVTPTVAAVPDVVSLLEQIHTSPGTQHATFDLTDAFFSIPVHEALQTQFPFTWQGQQYTSLSYPRGKSDLQPWVTIEFTAILVTFPFHKTPHWSTSLMTLYRLDLLSKKQQLLQTYWYDICMSEGRK